MKKYKNVQPIIIYIYTCRLTIIHPLVRFGNNDYQKQINNERKGDIWPIDTTNFTILQFHSVKLLASLSVSILTFSLVTLKSPV